MKIRNVHSRLISASPPEVSTLFATLATSADRVWPKAQWPAMRFPTGLEVGAIGGHGPVRYQVSELTPGKRYVFTFLQPQGFQGTHFLEMEPITEAQVRIRHTIEIEVRGLALVNWALVIRPLHDALIEDAFDLVERQFDPTVPARQWSIWVRLLRKTIPGL